MAQSTFIVTMGFATMIAILAIWPGTFMPILTANPAILIFAIILGIIWFMRK